MRTNTLKQKLRDGKPAFGAMITFPSPPIVEMLGHMGFDWVLIDTPPVLAVTDAVIIAPWVSGVVFVIGSEMTQRRLAERAVETLMTSRPHVLGAVLNRVDIIRNKYYYSRYYGYKYKNYYVRSNAA